MFIIFITSQEVNPIFFQVEILYIKKKSHLNTNKKKKNLTHHQYEKIQNV